MSSIGSTFAANKLTGGTLIGISTATTIFSGDFTPAAQTGYSSTDGSVYKYATAANAASAVAGSFATDAANVVGALYRDMGDRKTFMTTNGAVVAILASVQKLDAVAYEGTPSIFYTPIWSADTASVAVSVARI